MADEQTEERPAWLEELRGQLGNELQQQRQQLSAMQQQIARATQGAAPAPPRPMPVQPGTAEIRERIHNSIVNEPERYSAELVGFAVQSAKQEIEARLAAERQLSQQNAATQQFWREFNQANPDMQGFQAEVWNAFQTVDPSIQDWSMRANMARDLVRGRIEQVVKMQQDQEQRAVHERRLLAGAPGGPGAGQILDPVEEAQDEIARTADALTERRAWRAQRAGSQLRDDPEYHEQMRQRRNEKAKRTKAA